MFPFFFFLKVENILIEGVEGADGVGGHKAEVRFSVVDFAPELHGDNKITCWYWGESSDKEHAILRG